MSGKHIFLFLFILISLHLQAQPGGCLYFSGEDQYVLVPHSASLEMSVFGQMTAEVWVKPSAQGPGERIIMQKSDTSWGLYLLNGIPAFRVTDTLMHQAVAQHPLDSGRWHHLAGTFDGTTLCLWVNGVLVGTDSALFINNAANLDLVLGGKPQDSSSFFSGWMDEVRIWRRALPSKELRTNIFHPLPLIPQPQALSAYYTFDQDSGILLPDLTPLLNSGLLTNMDTTGG
ncbi:MAG: LamG domain-containing protein, partial [Bacteroidales bacterium]|nr:LamG domain-containing protein [Bacteroidales bacterium]